jgi:tetratricopeptide (TPR) repeat protein
MRILTALLLLLGVTSVFAGSPFNETFAQAQAAYDAGHYAEASLLYEELVSNGVENVVVQYNLANALFKNSDLPGAVLHYRQAWHFAPRDPDIAANLHFALSAAGAAEPNPSLVEKLFTSLSQKEWIQVAIAAYLLLMLLWIAGMLLRSLRRGLFQVSLIPMLLILLAAGGWWQWKQLENHPEWVVIKSDATTLFGPVEGSTAHYKVPLAALVRQHSTDAKGWIEIEYDGQKGWLKQNYIQRVSP